MTDHLATAKSLLVEAVTKQLELQRDPQWAAELPPRCPPVLWFGNSKSARPIVLTLGANPSRQEYLHDSSERARQKFQQTGDHSLLAYREPPRNRFRLLTRDETIAQILTCDSLQAEVIQDYDSYFSRDPYEAWFGQPKETSYKVEGFLRGFGASYYSDAPQAWRAVHIDLFPFATLSDFNCLQGLADRDLFKNCWAQRLVAGLIGLLRPIALILFGRANFDHFRQNIDPSVADLTWIGDGSGEYCLGTAQRFGLRVVGLSTNLGNPRGFTATSLKQYGKRIREKLPLP